MEPVLCGCECVFWESDQHIDAHPMRRSGESSRKQSARGILKRFEFVAWIVSEKHVRPRCQAREQVNLVILKRKRLQTAREFDAALLAPKHDERGFDMLTRTSEQIVVQDVPAIDDREQARDRIAFPNRAKPAAPRATAGCEDIARLDIAARNKLRASIAIGNAADFYRRDETPLLGEALAERFVISECD